MFNIKALLHDYNYDCHYSNEYGRYSLHFSISEDLNGTYDYLWDIGDLDEKLKSFFLTYQTKRPQEYIYICLSNPYITNSASFRLLDLNIYIDKLIETHYGGKAVNFTNIQGYDEYNGEDSMISQSL